MCFKSKISPILLLPPSLQGCRQPFSQKQWKQKPCLLISPTVYGLKFFSQGFYKSMVCLVCLNMICHRRNTLPVQGTTVFYVHTVVLLDLLTSLKRIRPKSKCLLAAFKAKSPCTRVTKVAKIVPPLSSYSYIKQVQCFLSLPSSVGRPLSPTKELDTLNWSLWWIAFEVRKLYQYTGFTPAHPSFQAWIDHSNLCEA